MEPVREMTLDEVEEVVATTCFPAAPGDDVVGLEVEVLPVRPAGRGRRPARCSIAEGLDLLTEHGSDIEVGDRDGVPGGRLRDGGWVTFEPGGQLEVSPSATPGVSAAVERVERVLAPLAATAADRGMALLAVGCDPWDTVRDVRQQLTAPRYPAMAAYLDARGPAGRQMMRHTASIQVNLDPGAGATRQERWMVANLAAPLAAASFTCSPDRTGATARRAAAWRRLDPTRTGFAPAFVAGEDDPVAAMVRAALDADVLLVRRGGSCEPGTPGLRFGDWVRHGHAAWGPPSRDDLRYHLTTLFHEVRPRGPLEIRSIDALPAHWRAVPAVLYAGMLYDDRARDRILEVLAPQRHRLPAMLGDAAHGRGVADPATCALAVETWSLALAGAKRLAHPPDRSHLAAADAFLDRYTTRGRTPADDLADLLERPDRAVAWAAEPLPTAVGGRP